VRYYADNTSDTPLGESDPIEAIDDSGTGSIIGGVHTFSGLPADTNYWYEVEAYLAEKPEDGEKSERLDESTAKQRTPDAPGDLTVTQGTYTDKIVLSFTLPGKVDIAKHGEPAEMKPLYFAIRRKELGGSTYISRPTSPFHIADYEQGKTVTWEDDTVDRSKTYHYEVQSFVEETEEEHRSAIANTEAQGGGWALSSGMFNIEPVVYGDIKDAEYVSANLTLRFEHFEPRGIEYHYTLWQHINPMDASSMEPTIIAESTSLFTFPYTVTIKPIVDGEYKYSLEVRLNTDGQPLVGEFETVEEHVEKDIRQIKTEFFTVQGGFKDKFVLRWGGFTDLDYDIYTRTDKTDWETAAVDTVGYLAEPDKAVLKMDYSHDFTKDVGPDTSLYFRIKPVRRADHSNKEGPFRYTTDGGVYHTLGTPGKVSASTSSANAHSEITVRWEAAQMADRYRITYTYTDPNYSDRVTKPEILEATAIGKDAQGLFVHSFKPDGYDEPDWAGRDIQVTVYAVNEALRNEKGGDYRQFSTRSAPSGKTKVVGPAKLGLVVSKAASARDITVSWNKVDGAAGYYVIRRQFEMDDKKQRGGASDFVSYYVPGDASFVRGLGLVRDGVGAATYTTDVSAEAKLEGTRFTLTDEWMNDGEYNGRFKDHTAGKNVYRDQQNDMAQGFPYRYVVVPVVSSVENETDAPAFTYGGTDDGLTGYSIGSVVSYTNAAHLEEKGFTIGFAQNVTASKGSYTTDTGEKKENTGIEITWNAPPLLADVAGFTPHYTLYRRAVGESWGGDPVFSNRSDSNRIDTSDNVNVKRGTIYEYSVGITNGSGTALPPHQSSRFIQTLNQPDATGWESNQGYMQGLVSMIRVSRDVQTFNDSFAEKVEWTAVRNELAKEGTKNNWGIDGYDVFVMNRNIDANWHPIANLPKDQLTNDTEQYVFVTNVADGTTLKDGLLKVLRDYRHYFKVHSYVLDSDNEKIHSPDPVWSYETEFAKTENRNNQETANFLETDYVKWGARQITTTELVQAASIAISWGIVGAGGAWQSGSRTEETNGNNGSSGRVERVSSSGVGWHWFDFYNYKPDMQTQANRDNDAWTYSVTFFTINTDSNMYGNAEERSRTIVTETSGAGGRPRFYGSIHGYRSARTGTDNVRYDYGTGYFEVKSPPHVNNMYQAWMRFTSDHVTRWYNAGAIETIDRRQFQSGSANPGDGYIQVFRHPETPPADLNNRTLGEKIRGGNNTALPWSGNNDPRSNWF